LVSPYGKSSQEKVQARNYKERYINFNISFNVVTPFKFTNVEPVNLNIHDILYFITFGTASVKIHM